MKTGTALKRWELALLLALGLFLTAGVWLDAAHDALAGDVLRLHVLANSDSPADQALKLAVRDRVLEAAAERLSGVSSREEAERVLAASLEPLARAGAEAVAEAGYDYPVTVRLEDTWFPTKEYDGFSLPAGQYRALKVVIGEGKGRNWWCVVFPPLCLASVSEQSVESAAEGALSEDQIALITGQDGGYVLKFRLIEWWQGLMGGR